MPVEIIVISVCIAAVAVLIALFVKTNKQRIKIYNERDILHKNPEDSDADAIGMWCWEYLQNGASPSFRPTRYEFLAVCMSAGVNTTCYLDLFSKTRPKAQDRTDDDSPTVICEDNIVETENIAIVWCKYPETRPPNDGWYLTCYDGQIRLHFWDSGKAIFDTNPTGIPYVGYTQPNYWAKLPDPPREQP